MTNDLVIDSLAIAPSHAAIQIRDSEAMIKQLSESYPVIVNGQKTKLAPLHDGDEIALGKHTLIYNVTADTARPEAAFSEAINIFARDIERDSQQTATLQVTNGPNIGKILTIKNIMTRLGNSGSGVAVIAKRKEGYFISVLENTGTITVNGEPLGDKTLKLESNDILVINNASLQFFLESTGR
jgi:hypothetical protein